ncbi:MAG: hypothetical protein ACYS0I_10345 [Planctomycetota bacterium]
MKLSRWKIVVGFLLAVLIVLLVAQLILQPRGPVLIEFEIHQDKDLILLSIFGEPPQFAIWLEDPATNRLQTVFVTYRSGSGDWIGKSSCPAALPRWFEVFGQETNSVGLPTFDNPVPDAVTGATPQAEHNQPADGYAGLKSISPVTSTKSIDLMTRSKKRLTCIFRVSRHWFTVVK